MSKCKVIITYTDLKDSDSLVEYINKVWDDANKKTEKIHPHILETKEEFLKQVKVSQNSIV